MKCEKCNCDYEIPFGSGRFCSRKCANSRLRTTDIKAKIKNALLQRSKVMRENGISLKTKPPIEKICPICYTKFSVPPSKSQQIFCSQKCHFADKSHDFCKTAVGGYRCGAGTGKHGYYKGIWCDSTYELAYLVYCLDHNIPIKRNTDSFEYCIDGERHRYYPDFLVNDVLIEIKGYYTETVDCKIKAVHSQQKNIEILYKKDLQTVFEYIHDKYKLKTTNLFVLYDGHKPKYTYVCNNCNNKFTTECARKKTPYFCSAKCSGLYRQQQNHLCRRFRGCDSA